VAMARGGYASPAPSAVATRSTAHGSRFRPPVRSAGGQERVGTLGDALGLALTGAGVGHGERILGVVHGGAPDETRPAPWPS
jgi:hypothetical protein